MLQVLSGKLGGDDAEEVWLAACNASFAAMIRDKQSREAEEAKATVSLHLGSRTPGRILCLTAMGSHGFFLQTRALCIGWSKTQSRSTWQQLPLAPAQYAS